MRRIRATNELRASSERCLVSCSMSHMQHLRVRHAPPVVFEDAVVSKVALSASAINPASSLSPAKDVLHTPFEPVQIIHRLPR